jgi:hypothetical protein
MHLNVSLQIELRDAPQVLPQDFFLDLELVVVTGVLVMASPAAAKMWTRRLNPVQRGLHDCRGLRAREAGFFFGEYGFNLLSGKNQGNEHGLAASALVGRKASQSVAAVDQLFDV